MSECLSMNGVRQRFGISRNTVLLLIASGRLRAFKVGRQWRFDKSDVEAFVNQQKQESSAPRLRRQIETPVRTRKASSGHTPGAGRYLN